eukprot:CAMPEP_0178417242 /NCGR_PEP_ID=MMETSP0689_2-20121128/24474_1 /TAXON_ID=160604 /ORGANISM="Amphidinium massartii, Strain CS-259" /LENGTH=165 /DNA_ID=CAMNT_0020038603 /DNA_START=926 /DNA_END=1424 /DNA_ORIENTATION=-
MAARSRVRFSCRCLSAVAAGELCSPFTSVPVGVWRGSLGDALLALAGEAAFAAEASPDSCGGSRDDAPMSACTAAVAVAGGAGAPAAGVGGGGGGGASEAELGVGKGRVKWHSVEVSISGKPLWVVAPSHRTGALAQKLELQALPVEWAVGPQESPEALALPMEW